MRNNLDAAGNFDIGNVRPGQYYLTAGLNEGGMNRRQARGAIYAPRVRGRPCLVSVH